MAAEETEITLGAGKLLGLFLMLAATCGIFFAVGYSLGKTSAREQALKDMPAQSETATTPAAESGKPAAQTPAQPPASTNSSAEEAKAPSPDLTFYKSVKENPHDDAAPAVQGAKPAAPAAEAKNQNASATKQIAPPSPATTAKTTTVASAAPPAASAQSVPTASPSGSFMVQIAAVSHEEDAAALAGALRKKSYAAAVVNNPTGKDKLFHVVLGPYASLQDAEAMKAKLQGEGYNPIVKR